MARLLEIENCKDCPFLNANPIHHSDDRFNAECQKTGASRDVKIRDGGIYFDCPLPDSRDYEKIEF